MTHRPHSTAAPWQVLTAILALALIGLAFWKFSPPAPSPPAGDNANVPDKPKSNDLLPHKQAVKVPPDPTRPVSPIQELTTRFPSGRKVKSLATFNLRGEADNESWVILKTGAHFLSQIRVIAETEILASDSKREFIRFRHRIPELVQSLVITDKRIELDWSRSPAAQKAWAMADMALANAARADRRFTAIVLAKQALAQLDPDLKRSLTFLFEFTGQESESLIPDQVEFRESLDRFSGVEVEVEYLSGIGITEIKTIRGPQLSEADLRQLARSLSLVMDYYVFPSLKKQPGDTWDVESSTVGGMFALGQSHYEVDGRLRLELEKTPTTQKGGAAIIKVPTGEIDLKSIGADEKMTGRISVRSGEIEFSREKLIVERAKFQLESQSLWEPGPADLLYGVKAVRKLEMLAHYEASLIEPPRKSDQ